MGEKKLNKKGILITLEGSEGCGKSTQIRLLYNYLKREGHSVFLTREPGGTRISDAVREVLLDNKNRRISPQCETLLYMASRAQLVEEVLMPKLKEKKIVLCDRWLDATVAYQGYGQGVDLAFIRLLGDKVTKGIKPILSLYLDLPVATGLARVKKERKADRIERKNILFHEKVREGYLNIAKNEPRRFKRIGINERDTVSQVHERIKEEVTRFI